MAVSTMRRASQVILPVVILLILIMPPISRNIVERLPFAEVVIKGISGTQEKQLEIYLESVRLLITLATLLFGGIGLYISVGKNHQATASLPELLLVFGVILLAGLAIFFGQLSYEMMVWMLSVPFFNLDTPALYWTRTLQYVTFMGSVVCFGALLGRILR